MTSFTSNIAKLDMLTNTAILVVPADTIKELGGLKGQRFTCTVNDSISWKCGLMAYKNGSAYITINKKRMQEINVSPGDEVRVILKPETSKYGMDVPEEVQVLLDQDEEMNRKFHLLTPGRQRASLYKIAQYKTVQYRIDNAIMIMENVKRCKEGEKDMRKLFGLD